VMGVAAYAELSDDSPFPPFDFEGLSGAALKQLAGNDAWPSLFHSSQSRRMCHCRVWWSVESVELSLPL